MVPGRTMPALSVVDLTDTESLKDARRRFANFAAEEISRLLRTPLEMDDRGKRRSLEGSDIALLVYSRNEARPLMAALQSQRVSYTFYKQAGLWQADEATHLKYVLRALARPARVRGPHLAPESRVEAEVGTDRPGRQVGAYRLQHPIGRRYR